MGLMMIDERAEWDKQESLDVGALSLFRTREYLRHLGRPESHLIIVSSSLPPSSISEFISFSDVW